MARRRLLDTVTASLAAASLLARAPAVLAQPERAGSAQAREAIAANATPFSSLGSPEFSSVIDRYADARAILLGQSTHGTKELYRARAALTARLVREHGFNIIAVEADWPDAGPIDAYVRSHAELPTATTHCQRFLTWM